MIAFILAKLLVSKGKDSQLLLKRALQNDLRL